jgi:hypothetical protein
MHANDSYTNGAATAMLEAARTERDFSGWLAGILARTAAEFGSTEALTAGRSGSCEADLVHGSSRAPSATTTRCSRTTTAAPVERCWAARPISSSGTRRALSRRTTPLSAQRLAMPMNVNFMAEQTAASPLEARSL